MNLLFVCSKNKLRSPTAEVVFSEYTDIEAIGAGTNKDAPTTISADLIEWADLILVMEKKHRSKITAKFKDILKNKKIVVLNILDKYDFMDSDLIEILEKRVFKHLN